MPLAERSKLSEIFIGCAIAVGAVAAALLLTILLWDFVQPQSAPLFLAAAAIAAWRGGVYASVLAAALSALALDYFFNPPLYSFELSVTNTVGTLVFLLVALLISYIDRARKQALAERERLLTLESRAREAAEAADRAKDVFLAMVTHELRSPLNAVLGWAQMLKKGSLDREKSAHALDVIERNVRAQARLVEDLLDISRARTGNFCINACPTDLRRAIDEAVEAVAPAIAAKRIRLRCEITDKIEFVNGDAERLRQIVWNLLSNAVKFTDENGQIEIRLTRAGTRARLTITDDGAGISPDFLPFVFDSFRQADALDHRKHKGLGLGLAIVRHLVEAHGGTISATSAGVGWGAAFTVELPLLCEDDAAAPTKIAKTDDNRVK
jgi:signal transduction histidine kinase